MKKILVLLVLFLSVNIFAQRPGGRGGRGQNVNPQNQQNQQPRKFSASEIAGIFYYDIDEVIKKIKVKEEKKQNIVKKLLRNYNLKIKEISFLKSKEFTDLDAVVQSTAGIKDNQTRVNVRKKVEEVIQPIRKSIKENELKLNKLLESGLSEKQYKKWIKYQKNQKKSFLPQKPQRDNQNFERRNRRQ